MSIFLEIMIYIFVLQFKGFLLLNKNGLLGFIQPHKFFQTVNAKRLREFLQNKKCIKKIIDFGVISNFWRRIGNKR